MPNPKTAERDDLPDPNTDTDVRVRRADVPVHCPMPGRNLWNSHPKVYIPVEDAADNRARCPYCGTVYRLIEG